MLKTISAEAILEEKLIDGRKIISKKRISKGYRDSVFDEHIRKIRTKSESKILKEAGQIINCPRVFGVNEKTFEIEMEKIKGLTVKEFLKSCTNKQAEQICVQIGGEIKKIHNSGIIHGDLTTSNMIVNFSNKIPKKIQLKNLKNLKKLNQSPKIFFIDFGLGFYSKKIEDVAVDLIVFKKTFNATHPETNWWDFLVKGYSPSKEIESRMKIIEQRVRNHK
jgi:Kae1-associated kinase Bud32